MTEEKRRELRLVFRGCVVRAADGSIGEGPLVDLSIEGLQFVCPIAPPAGGPLAIVLTAPQFAEPLALTGRVAWTRPVEAGGHAVGLTFERLARPTRRKLEQLKDEGIHRRLNRHRR